MKVAFVGGKQVGNIGLMALFAANCKPLVVVAYDDKVGDLSRQLKIPTFSSIKDDGFGEILAECDLLVSVHGREIIPLEILEVPPKGCINVHPCLYKYKCGYPIKRMLKDGNTKASVGVHYMTQEVDEGEVIIEKFIDVSGLNSVTEVYNHLYPEYALVLLEALKIIESKT